MKLLFPSEKVTAVVEVDEEIRTMMRGILDRYDTLSSSDDPTTVARMYPPLSEDPIETLELEADTLDLRRLASSTVSATASQVLDGDTATFDEVTFDAWVKVCSNVYRVGAETHDHGDVPAAAGGLLELLFGVRARVNAAV